MIYHLVLWLCLLKCKAYSTFFYVVFNVIIYILMQYIDSVARSFIFSVPMSLIWSWFSACVFNISCIITHLPFIMNLLITAMSSLNDQCILLSHCIWSLPSEHPMMMYPFSHCKCSSCSHLLYLLD